MKNLVFMLWLLLYPLMSDVCSYVTFKINGKYDDEKARTAALVELIFYGTIAYLLYEK